MGNETRGGFVVGKLDDGRFVAASTSAPFFCFRDGSEEAVVAKVRRAVGFWKSRTLDTSFNVHITQPPKTITALSPSRRISFDELVDAM